ncbi:MAG: alpha/beta fold hydrolase [Pseudomonadota bacterium]|nr:alpha/beta fold hydrolase [Pseudomonadota bacterium]
MPAATLAVTRLVLVSFALLVASVANGEPVLLTAGDGVRVHGEVWRGTGAKAPIVVAFHQAGSSAAEYAPIAPRLVEAGFTVLAIDQRSGDGAFGGTNRTAAALGREASYDEALPDLEAALAWAKAEARGAPVVVWGSSYSAALVFVLAAAHPGDVAGVVAFSPGEYLARQDAVRAAAAKVAVPVYIDQASSAKEIASSAAILKAVKSSDKQQLVGRAPSTHGASTLRADKNAAGAEAHWKGVLAFLARFTPR